MMLIMNMVEFCQNYRSIDQKSIDKLLINCHFCVSAAKVSIRGFGDHEYGGILLELSID